MTPRSEGAVAGEMHRVDRLLDVLQLGAGKRRAVERDRRHTDATHGARSARDSTGPGVTRSPVWARYMVRLHPGGSPPRRMRTSSNTPSSAPWNPAPRTISARPSSPTPVAGRL